MTTIDYAVVVAYLVGMAAIGFIVRSRVKGLADYFAGGRRIPWWLAAISHHVSGYSAFAFVGFASVAYRYGLNIWTLFGIPCAFAMTVGAFVWAPRWARLKVITPVEYLEKRFNLPVHQLIAWSGILIKFVDEGLKLYALAVLLAACAGVPLQATIIFCGVVVVLYMALGGLWAEVISDFIQFLVQFSIVAIMATVSLKMVGGWSRMWAQLPPEKHSLFSAEYDARYIFVFLFVVMLSYNGGTWGLAQRFYSVGAAADAKKAALLSAALYLIYPLVMYTPVWAAPLILAKPVDPEQSYALMAQHILPSLGPGLLGLFIAGMFAATMSMVNSDLNSLAAVFTKDIYQRTINRAASERTLMWVGAISTAVFGAIAIASGLAAPSLGGAFKAMMNWYSAILAPVSVPLLLGMLNKRTSWRGAIAAWVAGFATFAILKFGLHASWTVFTGAELLVTFTVFFAEGYLFKMPPDEAARAAEVLAQVAPRKQSAPLGE